MWNIMNKLFLLKPIWLLLIFIFLDTLCIGMGMGIPVFCILFGFVVGWFIVRYIMSVDNRVSQANLKKIFRYSLITSVYTFIAMLVLWGRCIVLLIDPTADFREFGIPMILFDPWMSFIGWLALMIVIAPFLQILTTIFGSYLTLLMQYADRQ